MTRLRLSLKSLVRIGLNLVFGALFLYGCSSSTTPTFLKENINDAIQDICKKEYKFDVKAKLAGNTLWIYVPLEDIFTPSDKPEKYTEKFTIEHNKEEFNSDTLKVEYLIKAIPEQEKTQEYKYNKDASEKINNVWKVLNRVLFSMDRAKQNEPKFYYLVIADIKNGFEIKEICYYLDLKKVSYVFISWGEFQHRTIQDTGISADIIGDKDGKHLKYNDITMEEFLAWQIQHRIKLKFQKPEVDQKADIDKEVLKIITYTLKAYNFDNFQFLELYNLFTNKKSLFNKAAILAKSVKPQS